MRHFSPGEASPRCLRSAAGALVRSPGPLCPGGRTQDACSDLRVDVCRSVAFRRGVGISRCATHRCSCRPDNYSPASSPFRFGRRLSTGQGRRGVDRSGRGGPGRGRVSSTRQRRAPRHISGPVAGPRAVLQTGAGGVCTSVQVRLGRRGAHWSRKSGTPVPCRFHPDSSRFPVAHGSRQLRARPTTEPSRRNAPDTRRAPATSTATAARQAVVAASRRPRTCQSTAHPAAPLDPASMRSLQLAAERSWRRTHQIGPAGRDARDWLAVAEGAPNDRLQVAAATSHDRHIAPFEPSTQRCDSDFSAACVMITSSAPDETGRSARPETRRRRPPPPSHLNHDGRRITTCRRGGRAPAPRVCGLPGRLPVARTVAPASDRVSIAGTAIRP